MPVEFLTELEAKVEKLIRAFEELTLKSEEIAETLKGKESRIGELEAANQRLADENGALKNGMDDRQHKLDEASERIHDILKKFEAIG